MGALVRARDPKWRQAASGRRPRLKGINGLDRQVFVHATGIGTSAGARSERLVAKVLTIVLALPLSSARKRKTGKWNVRQGRCTKVKTRPEGRAGGAPRRRRWTCSKLLRERIARQDIAPGAKLREHELAAEFGVPRTRIREVFGALESRGLIERIPNRGAIVSRLDLDAGLQSLRRARGARGPVRAAGNTERAAGDLAGVRRPVRRAHGRLRAGRRLRLLPRLLRALPQPLHRMRAAIPLPPRCSTASTRRRTW